MKQLLGAVFGTAKSTERVVDGAVRGLDAIVFTEEERAEAGAKLNEWFLRYLEATHPQNLARRLIAIIVVSLWALLVLLATLLYSWWPVYAQWILDALDEVVNTPFSIIIGFYFATHLVRAWSKE